MRAPHRIFSALQDRNPIPGRLFFRPFFSHSHPVFSDSGPGENGKKSCPPLQEERGGKNEDAG